VTRLLAQGLGPEEFGAYSITRRIVTTILPFSTLAMGIGLARYLGIAKNESSKRSAYLLGAVGIVLSFTLLTITIGLILSPWLSYLIFQHDGYESLFRALLFMIAGCSIYTILYSYYRGIGKMKLANLWQLGVMACGFLLVSILFSHTGNAALIITLFGILYMITIFFVVCYSFNAYRIIQHPKRIIKVTKELFRYGWARTPAGLTFGGLLSIGPLLAPHFGSLKDAGYLVVGQSLFRIVESSVVAFGLVALPKIARLYSEKKEGFIKERLIDLFTFLFQIGLFATLHLCLWSDLIVQAWLGSAYQQAAPLMRIIVLALIPYLAYVMLRSVIDAVEVKAVNSLNLFISLIIGTGAALFLAIIGTGVTGLAIGTMAGFWILGVLTVKYLSRRYSISIQKSFLWNTLILNTIFIVTAFFMHQWIISYGRGLKQLTVALLFEGVLVIIYIILLRSWKVRWIKEIESRIFITK
jgi:O-antigen/teichoic acid export membrane protein